MKIDIPAVHVVRKLPPLKGITPRRIKLLIHLYDQIFPPIRIKQPLSRTKNGLLSMLVPQKSTNIGNMSRRNMAA